MSAPSSISSSERVSRHYLRSFALAALAIAALLLGFVLLVDPYGISPMKLSSVGFNKIKPKRLNIDRLVKPLEVWTKQPKTIFLGTSRIHQSIDPGVMQGSSYAPAYNASTPAASLGMNVSYLELYGALDKDLRNVFVELFMFNFLGQPQDRTPLGIFDLIKSAATLTVSGSALMDSALTVQHNFFIRRPVYEIKPGGFFYYPPGHDAGGIFPSFPTAIWQAYYTKLALHGAGSQRIELSQDSLNAADDLIQAAKRMNLNLKFLATPNHAYFDYFIDTIDAWDVVEDWLRQMTKKTEVYSFAQPNEWSYESVGPAMKYWYDPSHFSLEMGRAMQLSILGTPEPHTPANFMVHLTPDAVRDHIETRRSAIRVWAKQNRDFVLRVETARGDLAGGARDKIEAIRAELLAEADFGTADSGSIAVDGVLYPIVNRFAGSVEGAAERPIGYETSGWAADQLANSPVSTIIASVGAKVVAKTPPRIRRLDIEGGVASGAKPAGFELVVPVDLVRNKDPIRFYALMSDGTAARLASRLSDVTRERIEDFTPPPAAPYETR